MFPGELFNPELFCPDYWGSEGGGPLTPPGGPPPVADATLDFDFLTDVPLEF